MKTNPSAALLVIGNEILSGRTQDQNINYIAVKLLNRGIRLQEVRIVADMENEIIEAVNLLRKKFDYLFTTGGIGPTHDDITSESIAKALNIKLLLNEEAVNRLLIYYKDKSQLNAARKKMAMIPEGAVLIDNPVSSAPGYNIENIFVMAGVPRIMQSMFDNIIDKLNPGVTIYKEEINAFISESGIAEELALIQKKYPGVEIGSYPYKENENHGVAVALSSTDKTALKSACQEVEKLMHPIFPLKA